MSDYSQFQNSSFTSSNASFETGTEKPAGSSPPKQIKILYFWLKSISLSKSFTLFSFLLTGCSIKSKEK